MGVRHEGRQAAVQFLYQFDLQHSKTLEGLNDFYSFRGISPSAKRFCQELLQGIFDYGIEKIDHLLQQYIENYQLDRLALVDKNILRIAIYELLHRKETPPSIFINEAINIAKKYGAENSGKFVNALLDVISKEEQKQSLT